MGQIFVRFQMHYGIRTLDHNQIIVRVRTRGPSRDWRPWWCNINMVQYLQFSIPINFLGHFQTFAEHSITILWIIVRMHHQHKICRNHVTPHYLLFTLHLLNAAVNWWQWALTSEIGHGQSPAHQWVVLMLSQLQMSLSTCKCFVSISGHLKKWFDLSWWGSLLKAHANSQMGPDMGLGAANVRG